MIYISPVENNAFGGPNIKNFSGLDLSGRDFSGEDLSGADFRLSRLNRIKLMGAELNEARFFLSSGLSKEQCRYLKKQGAKARFLLSPIKIALLLAVPLMLAFLLYYFATSIDYISIPALKEKITQAKTQDHYLSALKYNQKLLERSSQFSSHEVFLNASLEAAKIYIKLDRPEAALNQLQELYADSRFNHDQNSRVCNDLARFYLTKGEPDTALSYIKEIDRSELNQKTLFMVEMSFALILSQQKNFTRALAVYRSLLQIFKNNPAQIKRIKTRMKNLENKTQ